MKKDKKKDTERTELRDRFAIAALPALIARAHPGDEVWVAAYELADKLLDERLAEDDTDDGSP